MELIYNGRRQNSCTKKCFLYFFLIQRKLLCGRAIRSLRRHDSCFLQFGYFCFVFKCSALMTGHRCTVLALFVMQLFYHVWQCVFSFVLTHHWYLVSYSKVCYQNEACPGGSVVNARASHQYDPSLIPMCQYLSFLWVLRSLLTVRPQF